MEIVRIEVMSYAWADKLLTGYADQRPILELGLYRVLNLLVGLKVHRGSISS